jgi:MYXO-CTERM domain-containing protein
MTRRIAPVVCAAGIALACSSSPPGETSAALAQPIIKGKASDATQDAVVLVMRYEGGKPVGPSGCTATLLTPKLALTARHCVADTDPSAACAPDGTPLEGGAVKQNAPASAMFVFPGATRPDLLSGDAAKAARGAEIIDDGAKTLCNHDLALILLDRPIPGAKIAPLRLDAKPTVGEIVTAIGWGQTEQTAEPSVRQQREGVKILEVGPGRNAASSELLIGEGPCQGDSGGPLVASSGAVLAVLSRGGNGVATAPPDQCIGDGTENYYTRVDAYKDLILDAYRRAGQEPWLEGAPNPTLAKLGAACNADPDCQTGLCDVQAGACSQDCSASGCPDGFACEDRAGRRLCAKAPAAVTSSGCNVTPHGGGAAWLVLFGALALLRKKRRRS